MKAVRYESYGGTDVLSVKENALEPSPGKGQILIEVHAASINPIDYKVRAGLYQAMMPLTLPATIGGDFSGVVLKSGEGVTVTGVGVNVGLAP